jgi:hypothetical protein
MKQEAAGACGRQNVEKFNLLQINVQHKTTIIIPKLQCFSSRGHESIIPPIQETGEFDRIAPSGRPTNA